MARRWESKSLSGIAPKRLMPKVQLSRRQSTELAWKSPVIGTETAQLACRNCPTALEVVKAAPGYGASVSRAERGDPG